MTGADDDLLEAALIDPDALARAEQALERLSGDYLTWVEADAASLRAALAELAAHPSDISDVLWRMFRIAHDVKGQATTFGYPLVTEIGRRLCHLIESRPQPQPDDIALLSRHVEALAEVITCRLTGDGGEAGRRILERLDY